MEIIRYPHLKAIKSKNNAVTIGNFDGVHLGHQTLIKKVMAQAKATGGQSVVVTMQPLPLQFFKGHPAVNIITPFKAKVRIMASLGVDVMCVLNFNQRLASMSADDFAQQVLIQGLNPSYVLVGDDFRFGADRQGNAAMLQQICQQRGVQFEQQDSVLMSSERISSSLIREALDAADFGRVEQMMGRPFTMSGRVAHGRKLGRTLGFPTLNIHIKSGGNALHGSYVVKVNVDGQWLPAVASIGHNPTIGHQAKKLEIHVFDFNREIYGQYVEVLFYQKLRNEVEFDGLAALKAAIDKDAQDARRYFEEN